MSKLKEISVANISSDDKVIALMGPTGTGKSTFINTATLQNGKTVGHSLESCTSDIRAVRFFHPTDNRSFIFVDTPGFDDTHKSDTEILRMLASWLESTYKKHIKLAGIIYLHRISDNRMAGSPLKNLRMFAKLCGEGAIGNVILATTMWDRVKGDVGERREAELTTKYWHGMVQSGSRVLRFNGKFNGAWAIVDSIVQKDPVHSLLLQEELVDLQRRLSETEAGMTLYNSLQKLLAEQKDTIRRLRDEAHSENNKDLERELTEQYNVIQESIQITFNQMAQMKISFGRRLLLMFSSKKASTRPVSI